MVTIWAARTTGQPTPATLGAAAGWLGLYLAAKIIDDIQDGDATILPEDVPEPVRLNVALAFVFASQRCLAEAGEGESPHLALQMSRAAADYSLAVIRGQQLGWQAPPPAADGLEYAWQQARAKGGRPFALAFRLGAMSVGADPQVVEGLDRFGLELGEAVQAIDDAADVGEGKPADLLNVRGSLALAYAFAVADDDDRAELQRLIAAVEEGAVGAPRGLQAKLLSMGAARYLAVETAARILRAKAVLDELCPRLLPDGYARLRRLAEWLDPLSHRG